MKADKYIYAWFIISTEKMLEEHVHQFTLKETACYADEWPAYNHIIREHATVCHAEYEWARGDE